MIDYTLLRMGCEYAVDSLLYTIIIIAQFPMTLIDLMWGAQIFLFKLLAPIVVAPVICFSKLCDNMQFSRFATWLYGQYWWLNNRIFEVILKFLHYCKLQFQRLVVALFNMVWWINNNILNVILRFFRYCESELETLAFALWNMVWWLNGKIFEFTLRFLHNCKLAFQFVAVNLFIIVSVIIIRILEFIIWIISKFGHLLDLIIKGYLPEINTIGGNGVAPSETQSSGEVSSQA